MNACNRYKDTFTTSLVNANKNRRERILKKVLSIDETHQFDRFGNRKRVKKEKLFYHNAQTYTYTKLREIYHMIPRN